MFVLHSSCACLRIFNELLKHGIFYKRKHFFERMFIISLSAEKMLLGLRNFHHFFKWAHNSRSIVHPLHPKEWVEAWQHLTHLRSFFPCLKIPPLLRRRHRFKRTTFFTHIPLLFRLFMVKTVNWYSSFKGLISIYKG